jgi:hypothetical protein
MKLESFAPLETGTYFIEPDPDSSTRVLFDVPVEGWSMWTGAVKFGDYGHTAVSIATVTNLVRHGCRDHRRADPPIGPSVDDLAAALAELPPFEVRSPPKDVSIYGYSGKHLELAVPDLPVEGEAEDLLFTDCVDDDLQSWVARRGGAFYGYTAPGYSEEFWILDAEGSRLMIAAQRSPGSPPEDDAELQAILDSIRVETGSTD